MSQIQIETEGGRIDYQPGERLTGTVRWQLDNPATALEVRLSWYTRGKGQTDVETVDRVRFDNPGLQESRSFEFTLPASPYSFSGKLISLIWAVEAIALPTDESHRIDITIAPEGREVLLHEVQE